MLPLTTSAGHRAVLTRSEDAMLNLHQLEAPGTALLDPHRSLSCFAMHPRADRNVTGEAMLLATQYQARQAKVWQYDA